MRYLYDYEHYMLDDDYYQYNLDNIDYLFTYIKTIVKKINISEEDTSHDAKLLETSAKFRQFRKKGLKTGQLTSEKLAVDLLDGLGLLDDFKIFNNNFCDKDPYTNKNLGDVEKLRTMYSMQNMRTHLQNRLSGICGNLLSDLITASILHNSINNINKFVDDTKLTEIEMRLLNKYDTEDKFIQFLETDLDMHIHQPAAMNRFIELCEKYLPIIYKRISLDTLEYVTKELIRYTDHISDNLLECVYNRFSAYINNQKCDDKIELYNRKINLANGYAGEFRFNEYLTNQFQKKADALRNKRELQKAAKAALDDIIISNN